MNKEQKLTDLERKLLEEKIINLFKEQGYSENDKVTDEFGKERNLENEINEYIEAFGEELVEDIEEIDSKINEFFFNYEILKNVNEQNLNISEKVLEDAEEILKEIKSKEKELNELKDKFYSQIEEKDLNKEEKNQYKDTVNKIIQQISTMLKYLKEQLEIQINILKEKFLSKNIDNEKDTNVEVSKENNINLDENDKIKIAGIKELPKSMFTYLSESENPRVLRKLALNESLDNEIFEKLAKCNDVKTKELLLENQAISSKALEILAKDEDNYISQSAISNKSLSAEVLKELYYANITNNEVVRCIARNENTPINILDDISKNSKDEVIRNIALKNENHPLNNVFIAPSPNNVENEILYRNLLLNSSLRKNEILTMFKNKEIYADKNGNAIFPIKDVENRIVGAYKLDFSNNEKPVLMENSYANKEDLEKIEKLSNKIYESLEKEEVIEEIEEIEIE